MNEKPFKKWEMTRKMGKKKFIIIWGILFWGLTTGLLFLVIRWFLFGEKIKMFNFVSALIIFPICGIFFGYFMWNRSEKAFNKYLKEKTPNQPIDPIRG